jgi:hypothetical protein
MRKIILSMLVSLDGYFEGPDHDISAIAMEAVREANGKMAFAAWYSARTA